MNCVLSDVGLVRSIIVRESSSDWWRDDGVLSCPFWCWV